jgi:mercuric ion transport protein
VIGGKLFGVGVAGSILAAICCATPALAILLGGLGLSAWLALSDYVMLPALLVFLGIAVYGLILRRQASTASCRNVPASRDGGLKQ